MRPANEKGQGIGNQKTRLLTRGNRYLGVHGKIVNWAENIFEEAMLYVRVRFTEETDPSKLTT